MYNKQEIITLASKYLDRVSIQGLQELNEFSRFLNFFQLLESGQLEIKTKDIEEKE